MGAFFWGLELIGTKSASNINGLAIAFVSIAVMAGSIVLFGSGGGDDSHITWWVVDELVRSGHFHNFNRVALEQSSSLGLVLIAAAARALSHAPTPALGVALSVAALGAACWMTGRVARRFAPELALPAALLVATSGPLAYWGTSGMETALAALASAWLLDVIGHCSAELERASPRSLGFGFSLRVVLASALFVSVRPENPLLLTGTLFGGLVLCWLRARRGGGSQPLPMRLLLTWMACALTPIALLFAWRHCVFHEWFPHPVSAKGSGGARWGPGFRYLVRHVSDFQPALLLLLPIALAVVLRALLLRTAKALSAFVVVLAAGGVVFICASGGDWMSCGRFLAPFVPVWWLTVLLALWLSLSRVRVAFVAAVSLASIANLWFFIGLARSGGANGYPLPAALRVVPAVKREYALGAYPFIELANKSHLRDALLAEELKRVVVRVASEIPGKIWIASGQAGAVPYHVFSAFPDKLRFIDFWGLTSSEVIPCIPRSKLRHSSLGVAASPELLFQYRAAIWRDCHVPLADIVFNTGLREGTRRGLEARGYRVIYFQHGPMPNGAEDGILRGGTSLDAYIAVQRELADKLGLRYHELRWPARKPN